MDGKTPDAPVPYAQELEERYLPSVDYVSSQISELLETGKCPKPWWEGFKS
jgi:pyruvate dehydrogenase E1 component beta subunit